MMATITLNGTTYTKDPGTDYWLTADGTAVSSVLLLTQAARDLDEAHRGFELAIKLNELKNITIAELEKRHGVNEITF